MKSVIWLVVAGLAAGAFAAEAFMAFGLWFAPGWANQWPWGLSFQVVWPTGLAAALAVMVMTIGVGIGAVVAASHDFLTGRLTGRTSIIVWLVIVIAIALAASVYAYDYFHTAVLAQFPNGYNP